MSRHSKMFNRYMRQEIAEQLLLACRQKKWKPEDLARHSGEDLERINKVLFKQTDITLTFFVNVVIALEKNMHIMIY